MKKGKVFPIMYGLSCGGCYTTAQVNARSIEQAQAAAYVLKWSYVHKSGWLCPKCSRSARSS